jgi:hypothetical protein
MTDDLKPQDLTEENFGLWRRHPATKAFMQYLNDYAQTLADGHMNRWLEGKTERELEAEACGRVLTLREITALEYSDIKNQYPDPIDEEDIDNAGQITE